MAEERTPLLETVDLKKYFKVGDKSYLHAVDGINMKVYAGETIGVVGESGCGKSTLGRTILRLIEPTSGQILYNGQDITKYNARQMKKMRQELQIIFQDPYASLDPRKSVIEIIAEHLFGGTGVRDLCHRLHGDLDPQDHVLHSAACNELFNAGLNGVLVAGIGMHHIPLRAL